MVEILVIIFLLALVLFWVPYTLSSKKFGAPLVAMEPGVVERAMRLAEVKKGDVFYDLGSGDGRLVIAAALRGAKAYGIEIDWLRAWYSRLWIKLLRLSGPAKIIHQDFFEVNLSQADVVCLFLLQETNQKLKSKLKKELKPGARVVSYAFTFEDWEPERVASGGTYGPLYLYRY